MEKDVHNAKKNVQEGIKRISSSKDLSDNNKKIILNFINKCFAKGLGSGRINSLLMILSKFSSMLAKDFEKANKEDIEELVKNIEMSKYSENTKKSYKFVLKQFYKWLRGNDDEYPKEVKWIKAGSKNRNHKLPEDLLTEDEIKKILEAVDNPRDKALISTLYESGCRIGELLTLSIKNVFFDDYGAKLTVDGKTGMRRVRIVSSAPALATWLENHPSKGDLNAPLWASIGVRNKNKPLKYSAVVKLLKRIAKKAGIKKKVNPHNFRHSRATYLANYLTEAQMKEYLGWVQDSGMAATYVHLSGRDTDKALLNLYGLRKKERQELVLKPKVCSRCKTSNSPQADRCMRCGLVLNPDTIIDIDEKIKQANELMATLMKDKQTRDFIIQRIKELGLQEQVSSL